MTEETIPLDKCIDRHIYRIRSRNLDFGVYREATNGFIGIREKFGDLYLFEEYHWDFGTVRPLEDVGVLPDDIEVRESVSAGCTNCGGQTEYHKEIFNDNQAKGYSIDSPLHVWPWVCENGCGRPASGCSKTYKPLFDYMTSIEKGFGITKARVVDG